MRIPQHAQLDRIVTFKGTRMSLRQAVLQVDPNEKRQLRSGRVVTVQQMVDSLDAWEKRSNTRLSTILPHLAVPPPTQARMAGTHQQLSAELVEKRALAASGWRAIIERPGGSPKVIRASNARFPDGQPMMASAPAQTTGRKPHPTSEPYDEAWNPPVWGDPSDLAAYLTSSFGNEFQYDDRAGPTTGCVAQVQLGAWLLGSNVDIVRFYVGAGANEHQLQGSARMYLLGQAVPAWSAQGAVALPKRELPFRSLDFDAPIATVEPVTLYVTLRGTGVAQVEAALQPSTIPGRSFGCSLVLTPRVWAKADGGAVLKPMLGLSEALDLLFGELSGGVEGNVTLFDLSLPTQLGLGVQLGPAGSPVALDQSASVLFNANLLAGKLVAFVQLDLNDLIGFIAGLFGVDQVQRWEWDLHDWPGEASQIPVAGPIRNTIPFAL
jgi:hypothetical protein